MQELLGSLGAAKHVFLSALGSLLQEFLGSNSRPVSFAGDGAPTTSTSSPPPPNPFVDSSSAESQPAWHDTLTTGDAPAIDPAQTSSPDLMLSTLVDMLRSQSTTSLTAPSPVMRSVERVSPLIRSSPAAQSSATVDGALLEELQARVEAAAVEVLPPIEAELARTLASLLMCIERLATISRTEAPLNVARRPSQPASPVEPAPPANVYEALEREAAALIQSGREQPSTTSPEAVVGAARQVEQAERDLLWGRVDDLSERVKLLSQQRAEGVDSFMQGTGANRTLREGELGDLPRYSLDGDAAGQAHLPPAYYGEDTMLADEKSDPASDVKPAPPRSPSLLDPASAAARPVARIRKVSSANSEKMQRDLDSVSQAIERLYVVSPQLANQRVEPDRRKLRERQLVKLGNAIERLSQGRLEDQRAMALPAGEDELDEAVAERRRAQTREREQRAMDRMLDQIDRAASRTLADQRVELKCVSWFRLHFREPEPLLTFSRPCSGKRKEVLNLDTVKPEVSPPVASGLRGVLC